MRLALFIHVFAPFRAFAPEKTADVNNIRHPQTSSGAFPNSNWSCKMRAARNSIILKIKTFSRWRSPFQVRPTLANTDPPWTPRMA